MSESKCSACGLTQHTPEASVTLYPSTQQIIVVHQDGDASRKFASRLLDAWSLLLAKEAK